MPCHPTPFFFPAKLGVSFFSSQPVQRSSGVNILSIYGVNPFLAPPFTFPPARNLWAQNHPSFHGYFLPPFYFLQTPQGIRGKIFASLHFFPFNTFLSGGVQNYSLAKDSNKGEMKVPHPNTPRFLHFCMDNK